MSEGADAASLPATPDQIGVHVMVVLSQYFIGDQPAVVRDATAAIWIEVLQGYPEWAIRRAVAWWLGPDNAAKDRHRRPQPGDIAERCRNEMAPVRVARINAERWNRYRGNYPAFLGAA